MKKLLLALPLIFTASVAEAQTGGTVCGSLSQPCQFFASTALSTGVANAQVISTAAGNFQLIAGNTVNFVPGLSNTGPMTLDVDSNGPIAVHLNGAALASGVIAAGQAVTLVFNGASFDLPTSNLLSSAVYGPGTSTDGFVPLWSGGSGSVLGTGLGYSALVTPSTLVERDANSNVKANNVLASYAGVTAAGGTTTLTAASAMQQQLMGTGGQNFVLPDATTLTAGWSYTFNNDATSDLVLKNAGGSIIYTVYSGGFITVVLTDTSTANGNWDIYLSAPAIAHWGNTGLSTLGTLTLGTTGAQGAIALFGAGSGSTYLVPSATASGTLTLPATTGTLLTTNGSGASLSGLTWSQIGSTPTTLSGYGISSSDTLFSTVLASPPAIGGTAAAAGKFTTLQATSGLNSTAVGNTTPSTGAFTTLSASSTVSGTGFSTYLASPPAIGTTTAAAGAFTSLSASSQITSTVSTGTAPFVVASTTNVANLNASSLNGATFASPGSIGSGTPGTGAFTTLSGSTSVTTPLVTSTGALTLNAVTGQSISFDINSTLVGYINASVMNLSTGFSATGGLNSTAIGATTPSTGAFSTLKAAGSTSITGYFTPNSGELASVSNLNPGVVFYGVTGDRATYGLDIGYDGSRFGTRIFAPRAASASSIIFASSPASAAPTSQSDFTVLAKILGDTGVMYVSSGLAHSLTLQGSATNPTIGTDGGYLTLSGSGARVIVANGSYGLMSAAYPGGGTDLKYWTYGSGAGTSFFIQADRDDFGAATVAYQINRGTSSNAYGVASHIWNTSTASGTAVAGFEILNTNGANHITVQSASTPIISTSASGIGIQSASGVTYMNDATVYFVNVGTTASAANAYLNNGASNQLLRSTSARKYKTDIADLTLDYAKRSLALNAVSFKSLASADDPTKTFIGMIADDWQAEYPEMVVENNGEVEGYTYDRLPVIHHVLIQDLENRIAALEAALKH